MQDQSDAELLREAGRGSQPAWDALYRRHRDWAGRLAMRFTGDANDAADVVQDSFIYLLNKLPGLVLTAKLRTFLYPVIKHNALALLRAKRRAILPEDALHGVPDPDRTGDADASGLAAALAALPPEQREVLVLRHVEGMSVEEVAVALEVPAGTVKSRLHHAVRKLREHPGARDLFERE